MLIAISRFFGRLDRAPHALRGGWQFDVRYPELGKRINDGVDQR
jgi:hypothetical protein